MKTVPLILLTLLIMGQLMSQNADSTAVLQKCIDLEELQAFLPKEPNGAMKPVYLMSRDVVFPESMKIKKFEYPVIQMKREQIVNLSIEAFFIFDVFHLTPGSANVSFGFVHGSPEDPHLITANIELAKVGEHWEIVKSTIK